ncbi:MAG: helix-hairpin-helix domain-containing protein [Desulfuromonadaceae bacterium]|nr:helix-hairpin-helix domain-containing protein [Desulfuromonadaceae bacterium]
MEKGPFSVQPARAPIWVEIETKDGSHICDVNNFGCDIKMTTVGWLTEGQIALLGSLRPAAGEHVKFVELSTGCPAAESSMMNAEKRMILGVPLHPDRMSVRDWCALPGIGPALAARIEHDRHENGDFGRLERLGRVPGLSTKRIAEIAGFF